MYVIKIKDLTKYLVSTLLLIFIAIYLTRFFFNILKNNTIDFKGIKKEISIKCIESVIPNIKQNEKNKGTMLEKILNMELGYIKLNSIEYKNEEKVLTNELANEETIEEAKTDVTTEVVASEVPNKFNNSYGTVQINNSTDFELTEEILKPDIELADKEDVIIYHTHTCESYTPSEKFNYVQTGNYRTTDLNFSVARVGEELKKYLDNYGFNTIHSQTYHDYPAYTGSYDRSLETVKGILQENKDTQMVFDLHRDAIGASNTYAPKVKIGDEYAAQIMFVIGSNGGGLEHPNWQQNLKFAVKIQEKANEMYPGLFKPIVLRNSRYNQQVTEAATIIEVGATGNTLEECLTSMKYLAKVMDEALKRPILNIFITIKYCNN